MKIKFFSLSFLILMTLTLLTGCGEQNTAEKTNLIIATGDKSGTYYPIGSKIAELLTNDALSMQVKAESTNGSIDNINRLNDGKVDLAIIQNDIAYYAANAVEMYKDKKVDNLRAIASLYPETCQFITLESSGIKNIADLKGKKVAVGVEGSGTEANARQILEAYGITYKDINAQFLSFSEGSTALKDGKVDAAFLTAGYPTKAVQDIAMQQKIRILPIDNERSTILSGLYPYYTKIIIPRNTYENLNEEIPTISVRALLVTSDKFDDQKGREIARVIFNNTKELEKAHIVGRFISMENATKGISLKMNSGAEKFFRDFSNVK